MTSVDCSASFYFFWRELVFIDEKKKKKKRFWRWDWLLVSRGLLMVWIRDALAESPRRTAGWLAIQQLVRNVVETDKEISCSREREAYVGRVYHMEQDEEREG